LQHYNHYVAVQPFCNSTTILQQYNHFHFCYYKQKNYTSSMLKDSSYVMSGQHLSRLMVRFSLICLCIDYSFNLERFLLGIVNGLSSVMEWICTLYIYDVPSARLTPSQYRANGFTVSPMNRNEIRKYNGRYILWYFITMHSLFDISITSVVMH
jgi:hypothetical protein